MSIISRNFLHNNISIIVEYPNKGKVTFTRQGIDGYIDRAKSYLINEHHVKYGDKILLDFNPWPDFLVWFIAAAELGLILTVLDPESKSIQDILQIYEGIDHIISDEKGYIDPNIYTTYEKIDKKDVMWANHESILIYTTSSGSTDTPKLVKYTHDFLFRLAERNQKIYELQESDNCLHVHTLIHSSIVGIYFLPVLHSCINHFYFNGKDDEWTKFLANNRINKCAIFHRYLDMLADTFDTVIDYNFDIIAISRLPIDLKKKLNNRVRVLSAFGCSEVSGPVLLSINDSINFAENNFGKQLDDFYQLYIDDNELVVKYENTDIYTGDKFHIENGDFIYDGRLNTYKIYDSIIDTSRLTKFIEELYSTSCDIVVDGDLIYARLDIDVNHKFLNNHIIRRFNENYYISTILVSPRSEFINNVKFNANGVRIACRQKLLQEN